MASIIARDVATGFTPVHPEAGRTYPLIVFLHGAGEGDPADRGHPDQRARGRPLFTAQQGFPRSSLASLFRQGPMASARAANITPGLPCARPGGGWPQLGAPARQTRGRPSHRWPSGSRWRPCRTACDRGTSSMTQIGPGTKGSTGGPRARCRAREGQGPCRPVGPGTWRRGHGRIPVLPLSSPAACALQSTRIPQDPFAAAAAQG